MVCPKCGALVDDNVSLCDNCGYIFEDNVAQPETDGGEYNINPNTPALPGAFMPKRNAIKFKNVWFLLSLAAAIVIVVCCFYGAHYISKAGIAINNIQMSSTSIFGFGEGMSGDYYKFLGAALYGMAYVVRGAGVALGAITVLLGLKTKK